MTQGKTVEEAIENLKDAMRLLMEDEMEDFRKEHADEKFIRKVIAV
jgi:predicted RNase H-like HicB family nuclease